MDCFVVTQKPLKSQQGVDCEPVAMLEQEEFSEGNPEVMEEDHTILAVLKGEAFPIYEGMKARIVEFVSQIFDHLPGKKIIVGSFRGEEEAIAQIRRCRDKE